MEEGGRKRKRETGLEKDQRDAGFGDGGMGHESGNVSSLWKPSKTRKHVLPQSLQKGHSPATTLIGVQ